MMNPPDRLSSEPSNCPNCRLPTPAGAAECPACGLIFAKWTEKLLRKQAEAAAPAGVPATIFPHVQEAALTSRQAVVTPAIIFVMAVLLANSSLSRFFVHSALSMQIHEFGHALNCWLGGLFAIPIPMMALIPSGERSVLFAVAVTGTLLWMLKLAWDEDCFFCAGLFGALLLCQAWMTLFLALHRLEFFVAFGGLGGECYVSALLIILYFHPLPSVARWPKVRVVFLFVGACVLAVSLRRWRDASADFMNVPWGSFWGGDGDVEAMLANNWTVNVLVKTYLRLVWACCGAVALAYAKAVWPFRDRLMRPRDLWNL